MRQFEAQPDLEHSHELEVEMVTSMPVDDEELKEAPGMYVYSSMMCSRGRGGGRRAT